MPNTLSFYVDSISADRNTAVFKESTVNNLIPPNRQLHNFYVSAYKVNDEAEELEVTITPNDTPDNVSQWEVELDADGWYRISAADVPDYDDTLSYSTHDCVYALGSEGLGVYRLTNLGVPADPAWSPENAPGVIVTGKQIGRAHV